MIAALSMCMNYTTRQDGSSTKTSNTWGVVNNRGGTNTNRIVLLRRVGVPEGRRRMPVE